MVERPIKKSERQVAEPSTTEENEAPITRPLNEPSTSKPFKGKDKTRGKGKGSQNESKPPVNPALMRGPKPSKAKPPVIVQSSEESSTEETSAEELTIAAEQETNPES